MQGRARAGRGDRTVTMQRQFGDVARSERADAHAAGAAKLKIRSAERLALKLRRLASLGAWSIAAWCTAYAAARWFGWLTIGWPPWFGNNPQPQPWIFSSNELREVAFGSLIRAENFARLWPDSLPVSTALVGLVALASCCLSYVRRPLGLAPILAMSPKIYCFAGELLLVEPTGSVFAGRAIDVAFGDRVPTASTTLVWLGGSAIAVISALLVSSPRGADSGSCTRCGYRLIAGQSVCSECGRSARQSAAVDSA